jgi:hypothetical protein
MVQRRGDKTLYPPAVVRLALLAELVTKLGGDGSTILKRLDLDPMRVVYGDRVLDEQGEDLRKAARQALCDVPAVADAVCHYDLLGRGRFEDLCDWQGGADFKSDGLVSNWTKQLIELPMPHTERSVRAPRLVAVAGVAAWAGLAGSARKSGKFCETIF